MRFRSTTVAIALAVAGAATAPQIAQAAWGRVTTDLNLRTCASPNCGRMAVMPAGSQVWINGSTGSWYQVSYNGISGYASGRYIAGGPGGGYVSGPSYATPPYAVAPPYYRPAPPFYRPPPPPRYMYAQNPWWWDNHYNSWYNGRQWWFNGRWHDRPNGVSIGFSFGG
jgi:uncharacterized protein YraI